MFRSTMKRFDRLSSQVFGLGLTLIAMAWSSLLFAADQSISWESLSASQQQVLAPLQSQWDTMAPQREAAHAGMAGDG
jgi:Protein of unknown function (DUF3106)